MQAERKGMDCCGGWAERQLRDGVGEKGKGREGGGEGFRGGPCWGWEGRQWRVPSVRSAWRRKWGVGGGKGTTEVYVSLPCGVQLCGGAGRHEQRQAPALHVILQRLNLPLTA